MSVDCPHWSASSFIGAGRCAIGKFGGRPSLGACDVCLGLKPRREDVLAEEARRRWGKLHRRALAWMGDDPAAELGFIRSLASGMGCACESNWSEILIADPPDLATASTYFAGTVRWHNAVDRNLGKPELSEPQARELHRLALEAESKGN